MVPATVNMEAVFLRVLILHSLVEFHRRFRRTSLFYCKYILTCHPVILIIALFYSLQFFIFTLPFYALHFYSVFGLILLTHLMPTKSPHWPRDSVFPALFFLAWDVNWPSFVYHVSSRPAFITILITESAVSSKRWINFYQTVRRRIPKDVSLKLHLKVRKRTRCFVSFILCHNDEHGSWGLGTSENTPVVSKHFCPQPLTPWCVIIWAVGEMKVSSLNVHTD